VLQTTLKVSEISIDAKKLFDEYLKLVDLQVSEVNFTNFFMWKDYYKIRYCIINNFLCIIAAIGNKQFCFFPIGDYRNFDELRNTIFTIKDYFLQMGWELVFLRVSSKQVSVLKELDIDFTATEDRDNYDYLYSVKKLSTLSGKKLDGKRNHINKFKRLYTFTYEDISDSNISSCREIVEKWSQQKNFSDYDSLVSEKQANLYVLDNFNTLGVKGALIKVNGKPEAFTIGEKITDNTVVIHIEKANAEINGLYPLINQQFLANQWSDMEYVNREQDLGIEGLRKAKLSYKPIGFVEKFKVELC
jgi:hypothetical protein